MDYEKNPHVMRMRRHLPFDADSSELYEELAEADPFSYPTKALEFVMMLLARPETRIVILTGDAGHGKTHLCRRVLEAYGHHPDHALMILGRDPTGTQVQPGDSGAGLRPVRIVKDLSEIAPRESAVSCLLDALNDTAAVGVVCANEGKLREVVSDRIDELGIILDSLDAGLRKGRVSTGHGVHVVNLNYQSVAPDEPGFLAALLQRWTDGRRWKTCRQCEAAEQCPILRNRDELAPGGDAQDLTACRRDGILALVRTVEQSGYVLTIRECLVLVAYLFTGGLDCVRVARLCRDGKATGLRDEFHFPVLLFERNLEPDRMRQLRVLQRLRRFDPGRCALRSVDDELGRALDEEDAVESARRFRPPPRTSRDQRREADDHRSRMRSARRRAFFSIDPKSGTTARVTRGQQLGLRFQAEFDHVLRIGDAEPRRTSQIRDQLIQGLHVLQGIRPARDGSTLYLTDPAFGHGASRASIIARQLQTPTIRLLPERRRWEELNGSEHPDLPESVDWLDRRIVVVFGADEKTGLQLDLVAFELTMRAGEGVGFRKFFRADFRRLLSTLAFLAESGKDEGSEIRMMLGSEMRRISLDVGDQIKVVRN